MTPGGGAVSKRMLAVLIPVVGRVGVVWHLDTVEVGRKSLLIYCSCTSEAVHIGINKELSV